ncbi:hypothetical protein RQP46_010320 [Phenoliferia psychrophenolica]
MASILNKVSDIVSGSNDGEARGPAEKGITTDAGLHMKANRQEDRVQERSNLQAEGMFVPHMKHDDLVNLSEAHREVSQGFSIDPKDAEANERQV